jgi:DNA-binding transcriptional LysR family regulator
LTVNDSKHTLVVQIYPKLKLYSLGTMIITDTRLKHLLSVAEHGHFGLAAESLKISQPSLSKSIQGLEAALGVKLLNRARTGVVLTVFGELVLKHGEVLLHEQREMQREINLLANLDIGLARVKLGPYASIISGYPAAGRLLAKHPNIRLSLDVVGWRDVFPSVLEERADFGVGEISGWEKDPRFQTEAIDPHRANFFCRPDHPILNKGPRSLEDMAAYPWAGPPLPARIAGLFPSNEFPAGHINPINGDFIPAIQLNIPMNLGLFLAGTNVLAIATLALLESDLAAGTVVPVPGFTLQSAYGFGYLKSRSLSPAALAYMAEIRAVEAEFTQREEQLIAIYG